MNPFANEPNNNTFELIYELDHIEYLEEDGIEKKK